MAKSDFPSLLPPSKKGENMGEISCFMNCAKRNGKNVKKFTGHAFHISFQKSAEEARQRKEQEALQRKEEERSKEEEKQRKKEDEKARRAIIFEQYKIKKAMEEAEKEVKHSPGKFEF
jgi:hypothetical protein